MAHDAPQADQPEPRASGGRELQLSVPEMDCPSCATKIERALGRLDGIRSFSTQPGVGRVTVAFDPRRSDEATITEAIEEAGYAVAATGTDTSSPPRVWRSRRAIKTWIGAVFLLAGIVVDFAFPVLDVTVFSLAGRVITAGAALYLVAAIVGGQAILRNGYYSVRARSLDIDFLMSAGIVGALLVDLPFEAATLAVLYSIAELLERYSMDRARRSLHALMAVSPDTATVRRDGTEVTVPVESVAVGELAIVRPGERIPVDGVVSTGSSAVDESPVTGESVPAEKSVGDDVFAGSINESGYLEIEATATAGESTLAQVIELVEDAERGQTAYEQFIDRFAAYYTPVIVAGAILTVPASMAVFDLSWSAAFVRGLTLLVIACPCAFVISTPVSVVSAVTAAARNGVLIKGGDRLEAMGEVEVIAFDKTGTLTTGELGVTDVIPLNGATEADLLRCARSIEARSEHPAAEAITAYADERGIDEGAITGFEAIPGKGVQAKLDGVTHYAGKPNLFAELGFELEHTHVATDGGVPATVESCEHGIYLDLANETIPRLQADGKTVILVGTADELEGIIAIADTVRPEAERAIARLRDLGIDHLVMLTGDNGETARAIAERVGIDDVRADLLPAEKMTAIETLAAEYGRVAMVGDGINDAPALATADVGIAMGAAGSDAAIETADIALLGDDLDTVPYLFELSRRAVGVIRQNVWASLGVKAILAVGAPLGLVSVMVAIVVGDMGMSIGVTGNALRLAGLHPES